LKKRKKDLGWPKNELWQPQQQQPSFITSIITIITTTNFLLK
jgi:hypothetical protein